MNFTAVASTGQVYDPPHYVAAQLKTAAQIRSAFSAYLIDVESAKYKVSPTVQ